MSSSKFTSLVYLLSFVLLFKAAFGYGYLHHICSSTENFTTNDPFDTNLRDLAGNLSNATPANGFALDSRGLSPYQVYGLALCLVNVPKEDCWGCVSNAGQDILNRCPNTKGATIWYAKCLFKYRNKSFFGQLDLHGVGFCSPNKVSESIISFNANRNNLCSQLTNETLGSQNLYAVGSSELNGSNKLYGFTQCTRDISRADCGVCLDALFRYISGHCNGKQGGHASTGSCSIRYEMYEFLNK